MKTHPLPDPFLVVICFYGKEVEILARDPAECSWNDIVADIASGEIDQDIAAVVQYSTESNGRDVTADIFADVHTVLRANGDGCPSRLRDMIDRHVGLSEADKLDAEAGVMEAV